MMDAVFWCPLHCIHSKANQQWSLGEEEEEGMFIVRKRGILPSPQICTAMMLMMMMVHWSGGLYCVCTATVALKSYKFSNHFVQIQWHTSEILKSSQIYNKLTQICIGNFPRQFRISFCDIHFFGLFSFL